MSPEKLQFACLWRTTQVEDRSSNIWFLTPSVSSILPEQVTVFCVTDDITGLFFIVATFCLSIFCVIVRPTIILSESTLSTGFKSAKVSQLRGTTTFTFCHFESTISLV